MLEKRKKPKAHASSMSVPAINRTALLCPTHLHARLHLVPDPCQVLPARKLIDSNSRNCARGTVRASFASAADADTCLAAYLLKTALCFRDVNCSEKGNVQDNSC